MKKHSLNISTFFLTLVFFFALSGLIFPQKVRADYCTINGKYVPGYSLTACGVQAGGKWVSGVPPSDIPRGPLPDPQNLLGAGVKKAADWGSDILLSPLGWLSILILQLATRITWLAGTILNLVVQFTIVNMSKNLQSATLINVAWRVIRDVANMGFIFVLLYAGIKTILTGDDAKKIIVHTVIVAIVINFSLFCTKAIIDASNVLSITFYDAIAPGALNASYDGGLSNILMEPLGLTSLWKTANVGVFEGKKTIIIGVMGTITALIAAFVFFAIAIMFVIRFVVLVFLLILSPLAFLGYALPQLNSQTKEWWQALLGQAFFAPIYFMLTWIVVVVSRGIFIPSQGTMAEAFLGRAGADANVVNPPSPEAVTILLNFIIMIVFLITSLIMAKKWADKAGHGVQNLNKWAGRFAGGATLGLAAGAARQTFGRVSQDVGESERLKNWKEKANKRGGKWGATLGAGIRLTQAATKKGGSSSFDIRGTGMGGVLETGEAQKGGYEAARRAADKREEEYAKSQGLSAQAKAQAEKARKEAGVEIEATDKELKTPDLVPEQRNVILERAKKAKQKKQEADSVLGNKEEVEENVNKETENKRKLIEDIKNSEALKAAELAEKSAQDVVSKLKAKAKETGAKSDKGRQQADIVIAEGNLRVAQVAAGIQRKNNRDAVETASKDSDNTIRGLQKAEIKSISDRRKLAHADWVENSRWAKIRGYNYTAAAQIRGKSKKDAAFDTYEAFIREAKSAETADAAAPEAPATEKPT